MFDEEMNKWIDLFKDLSFWQWNPTGKETVTLDHNLRMSRVIEKERGAEPAFWARGDMKQSVGYLKRRRDDHCPSEAAEDLEGRRGGMPGSNLKVQVRVRVKRGVWSRHGDQGGQVKAAMPGW